jgi:hypothetical protein
MVLAPARPRRPGPDPGLDLADLAVDPSPGPAFPGPGLPGTTGEPDGIITRGVRPRRWRRRRLAAPTVVLAAVLAATVWAGVLVWRASPAAPGFPGPVAPISPSPSSPSVSAFSPPSPVESRAPSPSGSRSPDRAQVSHPKAVIHMARARQHRRRQRIAQGVTDTITVAGGGGTAVLNLPHPSPPQPPSSPPGPPAPDPASALTGWTTLPGYAFSGSCQVHLWTSQVSPGDPAYIAAVAYEPFLPWACEAMVETSTDGGQTWTPGTPLTLPASTPPAPPMDQGNISAIFASTGAVYDGPGYLGRACIQAASSTLACADAVSLGAGAGTPSDPALPPSTTVRGTSAGNASVACRASLNTTTSAKGPGTLADGEFSAGSSFSTVSSLCEGWLETSADDGATWQASPPVTFQAPAGSVTFAFIGTTPDGTGLLTRVCVEAPTVLKTPGCSFTW